MTMNKYEWKLKSLAKGIDPDVAVAELERIENSFGSLSPEIILNASREKDAPLHSLFEWDDTKAAEHYRLQQARTILNNIQIRTIINGEERQIGVFEIITKKDGSSYKSIMAMDKNDIEYVRQSTLRELQHIKDKLSFYQKFNSAIFHIEKAQEELS